jgi:carbamoyltransferase
MKVVGINAAFHDSAACLLDDRAVVAAAEEERFVRIKHHKRARPYDSHALPFHAIDYCLREAGIGIDDVDAFAYSFDPLPLTRPIGTASIPFPRTPAELREPRRFDPWRTVFLAGIIDAPRLMREDVPWRLQERLGGRRAVHDRFEFVPHHLAHAASAFYLSPFEKAAVLTLDGYGGDATTSYWHGSGTSLTSLGQVGLPHSLGLVYEQVTGYLGFQPSSDEYKVMALAALGEPRYADRLRDAIRVGEEGSYTVAPLELERWFGGPRRGGRLEPRHRDLAASVQVVLEETVLALASWLRRATGAHDLALAGGVALNCVMNSRLARDGGFERVWVQPAAGDAGTALGAALIVALREPGNGARPPAMDDVYLGPGGDDEAIEAWLRQNGLRYRRSEDVAGDTAELLQRELVIGWFQGRMEFGPRALGARSLLAAPFDPATKDRLNAIKGREEFRPVSPVVTEEAAGDWFVDARPSPFMTFVFDLREEALPVVPAIAHRDGSARIQTVSARQNPRLHALLERFGERTGCPMLVNTSYNVDREPIVCSIRDAVATFASSPLDALVAGNCIVTKA